MRLELKDKEKFIKFSRLAKKHHLYQTFILMVQLTRKSCDILKGKKFIAGTILNNLYKAVREENEELFIKALTEADEKIRNYQIANEDKAKSFRRLYTYQREFLYE